MAEIACAPRRNTTARLRQWKREATTVLVAWEAVWEAAGRPGRLGQSKAAAMLEWVEARRD
jgi:hypothetical protein